MRKKKFFSISSKNYPKNIFATDEITKAIIDNAKECLTPDFMLPSASFPIASPENNP